jgi:FkbM family methyltransferase
MQEKPWYQSLMQSSPRGMKYAGMLGSFLRQRIRAEVNGAILRLDLSESIQRTMFMGLYEPEQTAWFKECLHEGDVVIDVGASFGYYTTLSSKLVGDAGQVFAFEPSPLASGIIENAIKESSMKNTVLTKAAVGGRAGTVSLYLPSTSELHSPSILASDNTFTPVQIPVIALDEFEPLRKFSRIKLVKMDVEGYEPNVLDGMQSLIRERRVENIICEFNSGWLRRNNSTTHEQLFNRFLSYGYVVHSQTTFQSNLVGRHGELFDLQDIWFTLHHT